MRSSIRGGAMRAGMRGGMGVTWDDIWGTASDVLVSPAFWGGVTGQTAAQAPAPTIVYQSPAPAPAPVQTDYMPWIVGGVGVLALGGMFYVATRGRK